MLDEKETSIMLVDDDQQVLKAVRATLVEEGYRVEGFHDPLVALQKFRSRGYDLVLSDIKMPEMDGIQLLEQLRHHNPEVPVILHTGYAELNSAMEAVKKDAFDYLVKPVDPELLVKTVGRGVMFRNYRMMEKGYQKRLESEVQAATVKLFAMVEELEQARDQALEASRLKSEFLGNMSHELRTPLNHIIGLAEVILESAVLDGRTHSYLTTINKSAWSLNRMLNDLFDLSMLDTHQVRLREDDFNLEQMLSNLRQHYEPEARERGIRLIFTHNPGVPVLLRGDAVRLEQVLRVLLDNAFKFTDQGGITLNVSNKSGSRRLLQFTVSDTGIGIADDKISCIFESFRQVDGSLTRKHNGAGLGLAVARRVAELFGGGIKVKSTPGEGSVFIFTAGLGEQVEAAD